MAQTQSSLARLLPFAISAAIVVADRVTKLLIQRRMDSFDFISVIPGWLRIIHTENPGAAFGVLADGNPILRSMVLIGVSALVLIFVVTALWKRNTTFSTLGTRIGLALILGGAVGNLYDRIARGTVTDFVEVYHRDWSFPAFNVADSAISLGAAFLLIDLLWPRRKTLEHPELPNAGHV